MSRKALVLDANILIRAVLGQTVRQMIIEQAGNINFFAPLACFDDSCKCLPMLLAKRGIPADPVMAVLELLVKMIKVIETEWLDAFEVQARLHVMSQDVLSLTMVSCSVT